jgi:hypothetical protein
MVDTAQAPHGYGHMHIDNAEALNSRNRRWPYAGLAAKFSRRSSMRYSLRPSLGSNNLPGTTGNLFHVSHGEVVTHLV